MKICITHKQDILRYSPRCRVAENGVQEVLEILQPGPYNPPGRWDSQARSRAASEVRAALKEWDRRHAVRHGIPRKSVEPTCG